MIALPGTWFASKSATTNAYDAALLQLAPSWNALPVGPYPPASDSTNFPRSGDPSLTLTTAQVSADQRAEPGKITQALADQAAARIPKLNIAFVIGAGCLVGYLILRRR